MEGTPDVPAAYLPVSVLLESRHQAQYRGPGCAGERRYDDRAQSAMMQLALNGVISQIHKDARGRGEQETRPVGGDVGGQEDRRQSTESHARLNRNRAQSA